MDPLHLPVAALAQQLYKPEGDAGIEVGNVLAQRNVEPNAYTFQFLQVQPADRVLEIGFGPGEAIAEAARLTPKGFVAGIDHSEAMLKMATERNRRAVAEDRVELTLGDARGLPYPDGGFDKVFAVNVFHFWPEPAIELAECRRVLKPGGRVLFYLTHPTSWIPGMNQSPLFIAREPEEVATLLTEAGFMHVEHHSFVFSDRKGFVVFGTK